MQFFAILSPDCPLTEMKAIATDGFLINLSLWGSVNTQISLDKSHLMDSGLIKIFGKGGYDLLQGHLIQSSI